VHCGPADVRNQWDNGFFVMTVRRQRKAKEAALWVIGKLRAAGHVALLAGGCVRDMLLKLEPLDYDVATGATPGEVEKIFPRARTVGAKFGVVLVRKFGCDIEVATFRTDGAYSDGRRPDEVSFGTDVQDAGRRDFTINGMFYDPEQDRIIDHVGGRADLAARVLRTIGDPDCRFGEDHLRMLRAVRFAARFGFKIDTATMKAVKRLAGKLAMISKERVWLELRQIITASSRAAGWRLLVDSGLRQHITTDWRCEPDLDEGVEPRLRALPPHRVDESLAVATLLHGRTCEDVARICRSLKMSNRLCESATWLVGSLPAVTSETMLDQADLKLLMANHEWRNLVELLRVDELAETGGLEIHGRVCRRAELIPPETVAPAPLLTGDDLLAHGIPQSPQFGRVLKEVYRAQLNGTVVTSAEAMALAGSLIAADNA